MISKERENIEERNSEIVEIMAILNNFGIKIQDYDYAPIREKEIMYLDFEKMLDNMIYFVYSNLPGYKMDLQDNIRRFDKEVKMVKAEINHEILNTYSKECYSALFLIEDKQVSLKKLIDKSKYFQEQEIDIESEERSKFVILEELTYEYDLKSK